jgi:hypothetical protein
MTSDTQANTIIVKISVLGAPQEGIGSAEVSLPIGVDSISIATADAVQQAIKGATHEATRDLLTQVIKSALAGSGPADTL